jgi:polyphosphate kinase
MEKKKKPAVRRKKAPVPARRVKDRFIDRELSWLDFNARVLHEARDERTPLLERLNFLAIYSSNLDEFVMKRLGLMKIRAEKGMPPKYPGDLNPVAQMKAVHDKLMPHLQERADIFQQLLPQLKKHHIRILTWQELSPALRQEAQVTFRTWVFPVLAPLAVDPGHPFPFISTLSTSFAVTLAHPDHGERLFARVKAPPVLPQFFRLSESKNPDEWIFINLNELIGNNLHELFPGMEIQAVMKFRVTRNAQVERDEEEAEDLLELIESEVRQRRYEPMVRLDCPPNPDPWMLEYLLRELDLTREDVYEIPGMLDYLSLRTILDQVKRPDLRYFPWHGVMPIEISDEPDLFAQIRRRDIFVHHPFESFPGSMERFLRNAVDDPDVLAIKITLYRAGDNNPFIPLLMRAAEQGKQVVALVELKARFDEARNILLAQALEKVGVHVMYGLIGLKTHTKTTLVVRRETHGLRCYAHIGTGNYNPQTARVYTDFSLFTCRPELTDDLVELFHSVTGRSLKEDYKHLLVAPFNMKEQFLHRIRQEAENGKKGLPAGVIAKMNSLEDRDICNALYEASRAGVQIRLIIRGFCRLRAGVPGLSEHIQVISVIGRFLEHSRVFWFLNGQKNPIDGLCYIGSADWMKRNLVDRIEVIAPVLEPVAKKRIWETLEIMFRDQRQAWELGPDNVYRQRQPTLAPKDPSSQGTHQTLMENISRAYRPEENS